MILGNTGYVNCRSLWNIFARMGNIVIGWCGEGLVGRFLILFLLYQFSNGWERFCIKNNIKCIGLGFHGRHQRCLPGWWAMVSGYKFLTIRLHLQRWLLQMLFLKCWRLADVSVLIVSAMSSWHLIGGCPAWVLIGCCSAFSYTWLVACSFIDFYILVCWEQSFV